MTALAVASPPVPRKPLKKIKDSTVYLPHQADDVRAWARVNSFINGNDMGLGKSLETLTIAAIDFELGLASRVLVVAPPTLLGNWADEVEKHTNFSFLPLAGTPHQRARILEEFETSQTDILGISYGLVQKHLEDLNRLGFDIIVYDEAHYLKDPKAARTKACLALRGGRHLLITGSPLLNQVNELWALLHRIDPITYSNYWTFVHKYCVFGGFKDKQIVGVKNRAELQAKLHSVMLRRKKTDVFPSGKRPPIDIYVDAHPDQVRLIKQADDEMKMTTTAGDDVEMSNGMTKFMHKLRVLSTPANLPGNEDNSYKLDRAVEMIVEIVGNGRPVVVFTQFRGTLACLTRRLSEACVDWRQLHGDVPQKDRVPTVRSWAEDAARGRPQALLCMLQVAGVGLNLVAASDAIFVDELFVPMLNTQAEDRLDRIGQTQPVNIYRLRVRKSIEQRKARILETKKELFTGIVEVSDFRRKLLAALMEEED